MKMCRCGTEPQCNSAGLWLTKNMLFSAQRPLFYLPSCIQTAFSKCLGDMDDSNLQKFASGYFSHSQIIKITPILLALISRVGF